MCKFGIHKKMYNNDYYNMMTLQYVAVSNFIIALHAKNIVMGSRVVIIIILAGLLRITVLGQDPIQ